MPKLCLKTKIETSINRFFPLLPAVNLSDIETPLYYLSNYYTGNITIYKICSTILESIFEKAPSENGISNLILKLFNISALILFTWSVSPKLNKERI